MKGKLVALLSVLLVCGCSANAARDIIGKGVANAAKTEVGYTPQQCFVVKSQCVQGHFEEWQTSDGTLGCSCKK